MPDMTKASAAAVGAVCACGGGRVFFFVRRTDFCLNTIVGAFVWGPMIFDAIIIGAHSGCALVLRRNDFCLDTSVGDFVWANILAQ